MSSKASAAAARDWKACRSLCAIGLAALALTLSTTNLQSVVANGDTRTLSFFHTHSKESLTVTYKVNGRYDEAALAKLNHHLRDWRNHKETKMNPHLFDILWEVNRDTGGKQPIQIISAYRSPQTNEMLRSRSSGVARNSLHTLGNAIDFRIPGVSIADLRAAGLRLQRGGVGFYPGSDFVHMDTGTIRHWPRMTRDQLARVFPDGKTVHVPTDGVPLRNYQEAAADLKRRGQFGPDTRTQVASAASAPDSNGLQRFISSIFTSTPAATPPAESAPQPQPQRTQVASANPRAIVAAIAQPQTQPQERLQWQTGPASKSSDSDEDEETPTAALAYAKPNATEFPPAVRADAELAAVPLVAGAERIPAGFTQVALRDLKHPENERGFAAPVRAIVQNAFGDIARKQLASTGFQQNPASLSVIGFEPAASPLPRAASR